MIKKLLCLLLLATSSAGCTLLDYHPFDGRITGETNIHQTNIARIEENCKDKEVIKFILVSDTQRWYNDTEDFVKSANAQTDIDFIIHAGDVSDFGATQEYIWMRDILADLTQPYVVLIGNHDALATGESCYREIYGPEDFSFIAGNCKFVCLNTNALEFDYSRDIPNMTYIKEQQEDSTSSYTKTVYAMHARPYSDQFNNNLAEYFQQEIKESKNLQFCLNGHDHKLKVSDVFNDGLMYYGCPSIEKRQYLIFTLNADNSYDYELIDF